MNSGEAGDLRRYRAHYDVIVMRTLSTAFLVLRNHIQSKYDFMLPKTYSVTHELKKKNSHKHKKYEHNTPVCANRMYHTITRDCVSCFIALLSRICSASHGVVYNMLYCSTLFPARHQSRTGLILGLHPGNERRRYKVTPSLIGWAQT